MLNFLIFLYFRAFEISCSAELSTKKVLQPRANVYLLITPYSRHNRPGDWLIPIRTMLKMNNLQCFCFGNAGKFLSLHPINFCLGLYSINIGKIEFASHYSGLLMLYTSDQTSPVSIDLWILVKKKSLVNTKWFPVFSNFFITLIFIHMLIFSDRLTYLSIKKITVHSSDRASINPIALRKAKIVYNFGFSERKRVNIILVLPWNFIILHHQHNWSKGWKKLKQVHKLIQHAKKHIFFLQIFTDSAA